MTAPKTESIQAGASACLAKGGASTELVAAILKAAEGNTRSGSSK